MTELTSEQETAMCEVYIELVEKAREDHPNTEHIDELRAGMHRFLNTLLFGNGQWSIENAGEEAKILMDHMKEVSIKRV